MRVPARVFADDEILAEIHDDLSLEQLQNGTMLPGIIGVAIAMLDIHLAAVAQVNDVGSEEEAVAHSALEA